MIYKIKNKTSNFTTIANSVINDDQISFRAKGILIYLLSKPEDWVVHLCQLESNGQEGRAAVRSAMKELAEAGYAELVKLKNGACNRMAGSTYVIHEEPISRHTHSQLPENRSLLKKDRLRDNTMGEGGKWEGEALSIPPFSNTDIGEDLVSQKKLSSSNSALRPIAESPAGYQLEDWLGKLRDKGLQVKDYRNGQFEAQCPCHEDHRCSLSLKRGDKRAVIAYCHAGCSFEDVQAFLFGLPMKKDHAQAGYIYTDEDDNRLFKVVRGKDKVFRTLSWNGENWIPGIKDARRVPYRLHKVKRAITEGRTIYIVEGEKDVHTAEEKGLTATCNPFGAGKWSSQFNEHFKGATLVIVADDDETGLRHAEVVRQSLTGIASTVRVVRSNCEKDLTDHLSAGHKISELVEVM